MWFCQPKSLHQALSPNYRSYTQGLSTALGGNRGLGIGDWALGMGHWALGMGHWESIILLCLPAPC
ncbi:hypothetical protein BLD44_009650 [Mastigocladus laminosus UU774]|nr:hypothetical protein BLD44_009650 [Mastigocladus laminosus UU774]